MVEARGSCSGLDRGVRGGSAQRASLECRQGKGCIHAGEGVVTEMGDQLHPIDQMKNHIEGNKNKGSHRVGGESYKYASGENKTL